MVVFEESFGIVPVKHVEGSWKTFLILHKHGNHWGFPKGKKNEGESPLESAQRELLEETGLSVKELLAKDPFFEEYSFYREGSKVVKKVYYFPAIVTGALLLQPEEIRDGKWLSFEEAYFQLTFQEAKKICLNVQELLVP